MDNEMLMKMFINMMGSMSDKELNMALDKAKSLLSANDYAKLIKLIDEKRNHN